MYSPIFGKSVYGIAVDEYLELKSCLLTIQATDADSGRNGIVKYLLLPVLDYVYFSIDSTSGNVSLANYLTNSASSTLTFRVQAYDQGTPKMTANTDVTVNINRVKLPNTCNDILNSTQVSFEYFLDEVASQIQTIPLKPASLDSTTPSRNLTYSLDATNDNSVKAAISIDPTSGVLFISRSIKTGLYQILADGHEKFNDTTIACDKQLTISLLIKQPLGDVILTASSISTTTDLIATSAAMTTYVPIVATSSVELTTTTTATQITESSVMSTSYLTTELFTSVMVSKGGNALANRLLLAITTSLLLKLL